jgi:hypothetical protein
MAPGEDYEIKNPEKLLRVIIATLDKIRKEQIISRQEEQELRELLEEAVEPPDGWPADDE